MELLHPMLELCTGSGLRSRDGERLDICGNAHSPMDLHLFVLRKGTGRGAVQPRHAKHRPELHVGVLPQHVGVALVRRQLHMSTAGVLVGERGAMADTGGQNHVEVAIRVGRGHPRDVPRDVQAAVLDPLCRRGCGVCSAEQAVFPLLPVLVVERAPGRAGLELIAVVRVFAQRAQHVLADVDDDWGVVPDVSKARLKGIVREAELAHATAEGRKCRGVRTTGNGVDMLQRRLLTV